MQADRYKSSRRKDHKLSISSVKAPDSNGRKMLGGANGSRTDEGWLVESQDCDGGNDSCEFRGGVGGILEPSNDDEDCVEPGINESINSVILDQSKSCRGSGELPEWGEAVKEVHMSGGGPAGIGNCNEELKSSNESKSTNELDIVFASRPKSGGSRS